MSRRDDAIRKINAMRKMTKENGASEQEALAALSMANKLLEEYNLSLNELDLDESQCKWYEYPLPHKKKHPSIHVAGAIGTLTGTKVLLSEASNGKQYIQFFGMIGDITVAGYMIDIVYKAMESEYKIFFKDYKKTFEYKNRKRFHVKAIKDSFQTGMAYRLVIRINQMVAENQKKAEQATGTSLVVLKDQLVTDEFAKQFKDTEMPTDVVKGPKFNQSHALAAGYQAGDKVALNKGIGQEEYTENKELQK